MLTESTKEMTLSKDEVSAAIEAIKAKGWDINPYTVADELNVARSAIYRSVEFMRLVIEARGGNFGIDFETSLDVARRTQDLEQQIADLKQQLAETGNHGQVREPESTTVPEASMPFIQDFEVGQEQLYIPTQSHEATPHEAIYNAASGGNFPGFGPVSLSSIHWKELERLMNLDVKGLDKYAESPPQEAPQPDSIPAASEAPP